MKIYLKFQQSKLFEKVKKKKKTLRTFGTTNSLQSLLSRNKKFYRYSFVIFMDHIDAVCICMKKKKISVLNNWRAAKPEPPLFEDVHSYSVLCVHKIIFCRIKTKDRNCI